MEMRRSQRAAKFQARHSNDAHEHRHLAFSLARATPLLVLMILVGAAAVFFLLLACQRAIWAAIPTAMTFHRLQR